MNVSLLLLFVLALVAMVMADTANCAGPKAGKEDVLCRSSEPCDDDDDCENTCLNELDVCSNETALDVLTYFWTFMLFTNLITLGCCIRAWVKNRRANRSNAARAAKKAKKASEMAFHRPEFAQIRTQLFSDLNISLNCMNEWAAMPVNQYKNELSADSDCVAVISRFRLLSLGALELMKDEHEMEALSESEREMLLTEMTKLHEAMTDAAAVLARALIGGQQKSAAQLKPDLNQVSANLKERHAKFLMNFPGSLLHEIELERDGSLDERRLARLEKKTLGLMPVFHDLPAANSQATYGLWNSIKHYKCFYGTYLALMLLAFIPFLVKIGEDDNDTFAVDENRPGGIGKPFLGVPPQYRLDLHEEQRIGVPFIFGVMHMALVSLGFLAIPMARGMWRDIVHVFPGVKRWMPVDEFDTIHKMLGTITIFFVGVGAVISKAMMGAMCVANEVNSCLAFDAGVNELFDPIENVVMLRVLVWPTWFGILPLMYFARTGAPWYLDKIPFIRRWWFEICLWSHILCAFPTVMLALVARKEVFYPVILGWWLYVMDRVRDHLCFIRRAHVRHKTLYADQKQHPVGFRMSLELDGSLPIEAGMWMYVMVPSVDLTWHPFSIASSAGDSAVDFHIGIHPKNYGRWIQNQYSEFEHTERSWTYKVYRKLAGSRAHQARDFTILVRGPYGAAFASCFDAKKGGALVIGAGTGLTAAESVLREFLHRRAIDQPTPARLWFVWSCANVDDLFWMWDQLLGLLTDAVDTGVIRPMQKQRGAIIDWLGVTIYLSRDSKVFDDFCEIQRQKFDASNRQIGEWLLTRIVRGSSDDKHTHLESLMKSAHRILRQTRGARSRDLAIGFCGPPALAHMIQAASERAKPTDSDVQVEFSMDHQ